MLLVHSRMNNLKNIAATALDTLGAHQTGAALATSADPAKAATVRTLLERALSHIYAAHHQGAQQAAENRALATSDELREALRAGVEANHNQAARLEDVFKAFGLSAVGVPDQAMAGIKADNQAANEEFASDPLALDLTLIESGQVAAHFYIAQYGVMRGYAQLLRNANAAALLEQTIEETRLIVASFSRLAHKLIVSA